MLINCYSSCYELCHRPKASTAIAAMSACTISSYASATGVALHNSTLDKKQHVFCDQSVIFFVDAINCHIQIMYLRIL